MSAGEQQAATRYGRLLILSDLRATPWGRRLSCFAAFSLHCVPSPQCADIRLPSSFGDPNARPPTPQETPTAGFSSPLLQTPKQTTGGTHFDETSGWTPRFAEEYSVFNSTPGNLRGTASGAHFNSLFAPLSPVPQPVGKKRSHSTEATAFDTATHANQVSAPPATLATLKPAPRLPSSPEPLPLPNKDVVAESSNATRRASRAQPQQGQRSAKKPRTASASSAADKSPFLAQRQTQTATPPPSSKGGRKLAPKPLASSMQNQAFPQPDFSSAQPQQPQLNTAFVTGNPDDVFGYPMGPATAPPIAGHRPFWGFDLDTSGMAIDVDLSAAGADLFQSPVQNQVHRQMNSVDWSRANDMFQQSGTVAPSNQQSQQQEQARPSPQQQNQTLRGNQSARRARPLAPKMANMSTPNVQAPSQDFNFGQYQMTMNTNNPFNASPGGVDPGILFSQQPFPTGMDTNMMMSMSMSMDNISQPTSSAPANMEETTTTTNADFAGPAASVATGSELPQTDGKGLGSGQTQGQQRRPLSRPRAISPTKNPGRPNLSRSFSESARGGKRTVGGNRNPLPALAPARPVTVHQPNLPPPPASQGGSSRPQTQGGPSSGRRSPNKSLPHNRLSSLTSIPENASNLLAKSRKAKRASVKFVIDENGRARAETITGEDDEPESDAGNEPMLPVSKGSAQRNSWAGPLSVSTPIPLDDEEYSSSSDDEPIIIPSRNTSFAYPDPPKSSSSANTRPPTANSIISQNRARHRSLSDRPPFRQSSLLETDHDAMDVDPPPQPPHQQPRPSTGGSLGDAAAELRKVMQGENPRRPGSGQQQHSSAESSGHRQRFTPGQRSSSSTISEASLPATSPAQGREQNQVRCVCNRPEAGDGVHLVKWCVKSFFFLLFCSFLLERLTCPPCVSKH